MEYTLVYDGVSYTLSDSEVNSVSRQLEAIADSTNGTGILVFEQAGDLIKLFVGSGTPLTLTERNVPDFDVSKSIG